MNENGVRKGTLWPLRTDVDQGLVRSLEGTGTGPLFWEPVDLLEEAPELPPPPPQPPRRVEHGKILLSIQSHHLSVTRAPLLQAGADAGAQEGGLGRPCRHRARRGSAGGGHAVGSGGHGESVAAPRQQHRPALPDRRPVAKRQGGVALVHPDLAALDEGHTLILHCHVLPQ